METKILMIIVDVFGIILAIAGICLSRKMKQKRQEDETKMERLQTENAYLKQQLNNDPRPGSDAHYAAWREEQRKKESRE